MLSFIARFIATVGYVGYLPFAPGTWGSVVALPLYFLLPESFFLNLIFLFFILGWGSTYILLKKDGSDKDPSYIVIDELYAMMLTLMFPFPKHLSLYITVGLSFVLFRFFDIVKPWPIHVIDHYFEKKPPFLASLGVMIDDFIAALYVFLLCWLLFYA